MDVNTNSFPDWLRAELDARSWSYQDLADRTGLSKGTIGGVLGRRQAPGLEFCVAVGRALRMDPADLLRLAGRLPGEPGVTDDPTLREWWEFGGRLTPEQREEAILYVLMRFKTDLEERRRILEDAGITAKWADEEN